MRQPIVGYRIFKNNIAYSINQLFNAAAFVNVFYCPMSVL